MTGTTGVGTDLDVAQTWDDLLAVGLLGTERRPLPGELVDRVALLVGGTRLPAVADSPAEAAVLTAAGVLTAYRRAGEPAPSASDLGLPEPAAVDRRPVAPEPALRLLDLLLAGHVSTLGPPAPLVELWLERCAAAGYRLPPDRLIDLLAMATGRPALRSLTAAVGGPLGQWIGARNRDWSWLVEETPAAEGGATTDVADAEQRWATGTGAERIALLRRVRAGDPAGGLALVESTWKGEKAADRALVLQALAPTASMVDEPFLEAALDDRARSVRERAASLLASLPGSRLAQRSSTALDALVSAPKGLLRRKVQVELPEALDAEALARDGYSEQGRPQDLGPRAWQLVHLVSTAPLPTWTARLGMAPAEVVAAVRGSEAEPALLAGWRRAVELQHRATDRAELAAWVSVLVDATGDASLLRFLPDDDARAAGASRLANWPESRLAALVAAVPAPWPADLSRLVVQRASRSKVTGLVHTLLPAVADAADPAAIESLRAWAAGLGEDDARLRHALNQATSTISFRQSIIQELP